MADDTYAYFLEGGNDKEDVSWITTRVIILIFEDYLDPASDTPTCTSFVSDPHRQITLVWGVIHCNHAEEKMLSKQSRIAPFWWVLTLSGWSVT